MRAIRSKNAFLYDEIREALQAGRYAPGERIDPAALAQEYRTSPTPVRYALYRLVGEGMLEDHAREGLHIPLVTEAGLRDLYDWMQRLLVIACDDGFEHDTGPERPAASEDPDVVIRTRTLFEAISMASGQHSLHLSVVHTNNKLSAIRRIKQRLLSDPLEEIAELERIWSTRNAAALKSAVIAYHERRKRIVASTVALQISLASLRSMGPRDPASPRD